MAHDKTSGNAPVPDSAPSLQEFDKDCFFAEPVNEADVPGYSSIIKKPMDFSTMRRKATNHEYSSLKMLETDMRLMISNCMTFNPKDSVYYKAAVRLRDKVSWPLCSIRTGPDRALLLRRQPPCSGKPLR